MEDKIPKNNGRQPQKKWKKMKDNLKKQIKNGRRPQKTKLNKFSIPLKFRGKPFLWLAQLFKIFLTKIRGMKYIHCEKQNDAF